MGLLLDSTIWFVKFTVRPSTRIQIQIWLRFREGTLKKNWLARPGTENISQMHNLGTFWSDLGLPNHSVLLGWTKYPVSHPSTRFVFVYTCVTRLEPESLNIFFKNSLSTIVFLILCCSAPPKHIYRRGDKWSVVQSLGKDLHLYLSQVSCCAPHCCKCQSMLWRDCTIIIIIV